MRMCIYVYKLRMRWTLISERYCTKSVSVTFAHCRQHNLQSRRSVNIGMPSEARPRAVRPKASCQSLFQFFAQPNRSFLKFGHSDARACFAGYRQHISQDQTVSQ